ncbi:XRE family transcriptional regulator [Arsenophonus nasoniae]|uniref:XRE family transcriptional regulator n=1 Tax=Arsenophonus nasoniae TaxID=638 RepID=A0AA95GW50_9GAMM|nr:XRE family transcriptional regulator [Arsenophonus nasoniae]WGM03869.1 XRE family transcriptional regulator [Arsenophonus nasoniae]WGM03928.1 XRE family transcriptional regulator [Arsenophonus nasoniae]
MRLFSNYKEPSVYELLKLKEKLGFNGSQMADLALVSNNSQWRKYTNRQNPRPISPHILFVMAAQLALKEDELNKILAKMRSLGASLSIDDK